MPTFPRVGNPYVESLLQLRWSIRFVLPLLCFAACHAPQPSGAVRAPVVDQALWSELRELRALVSEQRLQAMPQPVPAWESAGLLECNARIGTLTDRLQDLAQLLSDPAGMGVAEATPKRSNAVAPQVAASTAGRSQMLQAALQLAMRQCEVHAENIANCNVVGYQRRALQVTTKLDELSGLRVPVAASTVLVASTGALEITERSLDVAIDGPGYFVVAGDSGESLHTRSGNLQLDASSRLVTSTGRLLLPVVRVPSDILELSINARGTVHGRSVRDPNCSTIYGRMTLAQFPNPGALEPVSDNLLRPTPGAGAMRSGAPGSMGLGLLKQGFVERSNVQIVFEATKLQVAERHCRALRRALAGLGVFFY